MKNAIPAGVAYESEFIDGPLQGEGFPASLGDQYGLTYPQYEGVPREYFPINAGLGSLDLVSPRDIGGSSMPPRALVISGPVGMDQRPYLDFNTDITRLNLLDQAQGPNGALDTSTQLYLAYLNSQLQPITETQSAEAFAYGL